MFAVADEVESNDVEAMLDSPPPLNWELGLQQLLSENGAFRAGHYRLYKHEVLKSALTGKDDLLVFERCLDKKEIEKLNQLDEDEGIDQVVEVLWEKMCDAPVMMDQLMETALARNPRLKHKIERDIVPESLEYYAKLFVGDYPMKMDMLTRTLEPFLLCEQLKAPEYDSIVTHVAKLNKDKLYDRASCYLMRSLPTVIRRDFSPSEWYFDLLQACRHDKYNRTIPEFIDPNCQIQIEIHNAKQRISHVNISGSVTKGSDANGAPRTVKECSQEENCNRSCRAQKGYEKFREKRIAGMSLTAVPEPDAIRLRPYQEELVNAACRGVNTIICAPTGSGKTIVATHIIREHLLTCNNNGQPARVAMMVPTIPLVEQQTCALNRYLRKVYWVEGISGSEVTDEDGRAPFVLASNITVFTPQIFINLLKSIREDERLYFTDFTMFVFDECHHCDADHPYHGLMRMLHDFKGTKPQIVGMTASLPLGSGRANVEAALDHMMELCANLSAHSISTVRKHMDNLQKHVTPPIDEVRNVRRPSFDAFLLAVTNCMAKIENAVRKGLEGFVKRLGLRPDEIHFPDRDIRYESFIGSLKNRITRDMVGSSTKKQLLQMVDHLDYYYRTLTLSDVLPNIYGYEYLLSKIEAEPIQLDEHAAEIQRELHELFYGHVKPDELNLAWNDRGENKEIISQLHTILREHHEGNPNSRTIIFVTTRLVAEKLSDHLNKMRVVDSGSKAIGFVTSSNQSSSLSGQSAVEQRQMLDEFNCGNRRVLVATSVAEEGLDISACNLIIKYNNTGSEKTLIQRRGRARAKNSRSILLALDGSIEKRELENVQKEELMLRCLKHMQTISETQMKNLVATKMKEQKILREKQLLQLKERREFLAGRSCNLSCIQCGAFLCRSDAMRVACDIQYVCCDPSIWQRIVPRIHSNSKVISVAMRVGKVHCKGTETYECNQPLGTLIRLYDAFLPTISAKAITVHSVDGGHETGTRVDTKKWESICRNNFFVDPITDADLKVMLTALLDHSREAYCMLEAEASLIAQRAANEAKRHRRGAPAGYSMDD